MTLILGGVHPVASRAGTMGDRESGADPLMKRYPYRDCVVGTDRPIFMLAVFTTTHLVIDQPKDHRAHVRCCTRRSSTDCTPLRQGEPTCTCCWGLRLSPQGLGLGQPRHVWLLLPLENIPSSLKIPSNTASPQYSTVTCSCRVTAESGVTGIAVPSKSGRAGRPARSNIVGAKST